MTGPLIIKDFDQGTGSSPHKGFGLMKLVDIESWPGALKSQKSPTSWFHTADSKTFTADASTDVCTASLNSTVNLTGVAVTLTTTGTLPAGLSTGTVYFIIKVGASTFKFATTIANANAGTAIDITDAGSGTHTVTSVNPGTVNHIVKDERTSRYFFQDSNNRVWYASSGEQAKLLKGNTLTNGVGNGLAIRMHSDATATYLFAFRDQKIDAVNVFGTSQVEAPSWSNDWATMNSGAGSNYRHHAILAQDNIIYFTDSRYVGTIRESGAGISTYLFSNNALDVPLLEVLVHLEELGTNLLASGSTFNKIYPWDRTSDSFSMPIDVPERGVHRMKNIGGIVYILAGTLGNIYSTQGTYSRFVTKLPFQVTNNAGSVMGNPITWGGIDSVGDSLVFGAGVQTSGNSGVYRLFSDGSLILDQIPSSGSTNVTAIYSAKDSFYLMGYASGADYHSTSLYSNYECVIQSGFYRVAGKTEKSTFSSLELVIAKPATTGAVRISYRADTSSAFTTLATFSMDSVSTTFDSDIGLTDVENIQIQVEFGGTPEIVEIRLLP